MMINDHKKRKLNKNEFRQVHNFHSFAMNQIVTEMAAAVLSTAWAEEENDEVAVAPVDEIVLQNLAEKTAAAADADK